MNAVISIVPRLPPAIDGLGDYALNLARQLYVDFSLHTRFIVADPTWSEKNEVEGLSTSRLRHRSASALISSLNTSNTAPTVLLHYVGYGYAQRGAPVWLINGLERWRAQGDKNRLLTMFHEVYASGPPWTSSFWLSPLQKRLASRLARLTDACFTSGEDYAQLLSTLSRSKHAAISTLPVFSTIGEPKQPTLLKDRQRQLVVFGSEGNRRRVYEKSQAALENVCRALAIERIYDVGPSTKSFVPHLNGIPITPMSNRPAEEISALLSNSIAGFFDYNTAFLAKSTIFAAYSAHRLIPISATGAAAQMDGIEPGKHYWIASPHYTKLSPAVGQKTADNAYAWYQTHKLSAHVKAFAAEIGCANDLCLV